MKQPGIKLITAAIAAIMASTNASAGGFSLYTEGSAASIGNYAAGVAAEAADASTGWYNPAGLVLLGKKQVILSGVGVLPSSKLTGTSTFTTRPLPNYTQNFADLQGGKNALVPALHFALPLGSNAAFGLSVVSPFGLSTNYSDTSPVRYAATKSEFMTVDVSPEIAGKLTDNLAVGLGLDMQWASVKYNQMLGAPTLLQAGRLNPFLFDSLSNNKGTSIGFGFHAGIMTMFNDNRTRVGLNYQSQVRQSFNGTSVLTGRLADPTLANPFATFSSEILSSNEINLPDVTTLSAYHELNAKLALLGSVVYTGWNSIQTIQLNQVAAFSQTSGRTFVNSTSIQNYRNTWRFALGANYHLTDSLMLRVGGGYDQTPTVDEQRDVRLPDANRWALSIGSHYQATPAVGLDFGYTYLFAAQNPIINKTNVLSPTASYIVNATTKVNAQLVGLQAVWTIDAPVASVTK